MHLVDTGIYVAPAATALLMVHIHRPSASRVRTWSAVRISQSPTLKWVAGGVWDEFQKRMPLLWAWSGSIHGMHFFAAQWVASISFWRVHDGLAVLDALLCWGFGLYAVVARRPAHRLWVVSFSARSWLTLLAAHYWRCSSPSSIWAGPH